MEKDIFAHVRTFEWDDDKRWANLRDHGIDFEDARVVIDGPTIVRRSDRKGEVRYMVFGYVEGEETVVVCTLRGESCRIISARRARRDERKKYHGRLPRPPEERED
ncbi:MAG: BrnT family toxin [Xanthobacteraceae bacterium]